MAETRFTKVTANVSGTYAKEYSLWQNGSMLIPWQDSNIFLLENAGEYELRCRDAAGCTIPPTPIVIKGGEIDYFERSSLDYYSGNTGAFHIDTETTGFGDPPIEGAKLLDFYVDDFGLKQIISTAGLPNYPDLNSTFSLRFFITDSWGDLAGMDAVSVLFGVQDGSKYYEARLDPAAGQIEFWQAGNQLHTEACGTFPTREWLEWYVEWKSNNDITVEYRRADGTVIKSFTVNDDTYVDGGIGYRHDGGFYRISIAYDQFDLLGTV